MVLQPDLEGAQAAFERAIAGAPERYTPRVDLALFVFQPQGLEAKAEKILREVSGATLPPGDPELLEDRRAIRRAQEALNGAPEALNSDPVELDAAEPSGGSK
jgi:hypothetical protein